MAPPVDGSSRSGQAARWSALTLEALALVYAVALLAFVVTGGFTIGPVSMLDVHKPLFAFVILTTVRLGLGGRFELAVLAWQRMGLGTRPLISVTVPHAVVDTAFALVVTRAAVVAVGFIANLLFPAARARPFPIPFEQDRFVETFAAWDSGWYLDIATRGYYFDAAAESSIAFFPLYPTLMRALAWPFGGTYPATWVAGLVVSWGAFALALVALHRFTETLSGDRAVARATVLYVAVFPFSFFFTRIYAESLFLLLSVLAVSSAYGGGWTRAGVWGAAATLTRPQGILIALPLLLLALRGRPAGRELAGRLAALTPVPLALAAYCAYVYSLSGDALAWFRAQDQWGYSLGHPPWRELLNVTERIVEHGPYEYFFLSERAPFDLFHGAAGLLVLAFVPAVFRRFGAPLGIYVLVALLIPLTANVLEGVGRYASVLFPVFMVMGHVTSPRVHDAIVIVGSIFLALFTALFVNQYPIY